MKIDLVSNLVENLKQTKQTKQTKQMKMMIRNFANPNHVCEMCNRHFSIQIKTQSYITFPGLIELKTHATHQWCDVFKYNRTKSKKNVV